MSSSHTQPMKRKEAPRFFIPSTGPSPATQTHLHDNPSTVTPRLDTQPPTYPDSDTQPSLPPNALPSVTAPTTPHPHRQPQNMASQSQSISRLRSALQAYSVNESGSEYGVNLSRSSSGGYGMDKGKEKERDDYMEGKTKRDSEIMDGLVEIHRVLYRGKGQGRFREDVREVKRVLDKWFEGDCVYDHPLLRVGTRQSLSAHFILLHLASAAYVPSLSPGSLLLHARNVTSRIRSRVLGQDEVVHDDVEAGQGGKERKKSMRRDRQMAEWYDEKTGYNGEANVRLLKDGVVEDGGWWKLWDVRGDCREIGTMESYDGHHVAMIEQVISLTLLPTIARPRPVTSLLHSSSTSSSSLSTSSSYDDPKKPSLSYLRRLAAALAAEFDYLLHWDLPISTIVAFNEVGKATHVRDMIDVRDAIETFVPLAKRLGWLTRRLTGLVSSTIGGIALGMIAGPAGEKVGTVKVAVGAYEVDRRTPDLVFPDAKQGLGSAIGLGSGISQLTSPPVTLKEDVNLLGLRGVGDGVTGLECALGTMAPDCDAPEIDGTA